MIDFFDRLGNTLSDLIGSNENNNVGHVATKLFAEGGLYSDRSLATPDRDPYSYGLGNVLRDTGKAVDKSYSATGKHSSYNDPYFETPKIISAYGNFFKGADTGSTNKPVSTSQPNKIQQSEQPSDFYARWYDSMRKFAQAEEVANRGQVQVRTK